MSYLTIRSAGSQPARRVDLGRFAELFAEAGAGVESSVRERRRPAHLVAAALLLAVLAGDLPSSGCPAFSAGPIAAPAVTPS